MKTHTKRILAGALILGILAQPTRAHAMQETIPHVPPIITLMGTVIMTGALIAFKWYCGDFDKPCHENMSEEKEAPVGVHLDPQIKNPVRSYSGPRTELRVQTLIKEATKVQEQLLREAKKKKKQQRKTTKNRIDVVKKHVSNKK